MTARADVHLPACGNNGVISYNLYGSYKALIWALIIMVYGRDGFFWVAWSAAGLQMTDTGGYRDDRQGGCRVQPELVEGHARKNADASATSTRGSGARR